MDSFRLVNQEPDQYTWWSNRGQAWAKNVGWRLDYQVITLSLADSVSAAAIYKDERFSDHAPQIMDYDLEIRG
jgi:exodeoxyribonuclease-3